MRSAHVYSNKICIKLPVNLYINYYLGSYTKMTNSLDEVQYSKNHTKFYSGSQQPKTNVNNRLWHCISLPEVTRESENGEMSN